MGVEGRWKNKKERGERGEEGVLRAAGSSCGVHYSTSLARARRRPDTFIHQLKE